MSYTYFIYSEMVSFLATNSAVMYDVWALLHGFLFFYTDIRYPVNLRVW